MDAECQSIVDILPEGWYRGGSHPGMYIMGLDETVFHTGTASAFIKSRETIAVGTQEDVENVKLRFGTVFQNFYPKDYLFQRVRLTAYLRYNLDDGVSWGGMWMKVEFMVDEQKTGVLLDNMSDRKLSGSSDVCIFFGKGNFLVF